MNQREARIFKVLLNQYEESKQTKILNFLNTHERTQILAEESTTQDVAPLLFQYQQTLERLHYSWLKPLLKNFSPQLTSLLLSSLSSEQALGLKLPQIPFVHLNGRVKQFLRGQLFKYLDIQNLLPIEFLPQSAFSALLSMQKQELMEIFDFLGLYDLAPEVRKIVNPARLKSIYTALTPKQFHFLKICMNQKEKLVSTPLGIDALNFNNKTLKQLIHKRGLIRFSRALSNEHKDFVWYIAHRLDTGRGQIILDQLQKPAPPAIVSFLYQQFTQVINFLKKE